MNTFALEIITPEGKLFQKDCVQVNAPGAEGRFGILAYHMNFVSSLVAGVVEIYTDETTLQKIVVSDGILEVSDNKCTVLVEQGNDLKNLSLTTLENLIAQAERKLENADTQQLQQAVHNELAYLGELRKQAAN